MAGINLHEGVLQDCLQSVMKSEFVALAYDYSMFIELFCLFERLRDIATKSTKYLFSQNV